MDAGKKDILSHKRRELQERHKIKSYIDRHILPWLEIYEQLKSDSADITIPFFAANLDTDPALFEDELRRLFGVRFQEYTGNRIGAEHLPFHTEMERVFPSMRQLRYLPEGTSISGDKEAQTAVSDYLMTKRISENADGNPDKRLLILYDTYSPVMDLNLRGLLANWDVIFNPIENVSVIAPNFSWMLFRSLEDEWLWVENPDNISG